MEITNPLRKSDIILHQLHHFHGMFESVISLQVKLVEEFQDQVPNSLNFNVGHFKGQSHSKMSLVSNDYLYAHYR